ncbi:MAG: peptidyl-prolyl cis-trans isomerase [Spirochaetaceae bacterium]|nr:peptidyl-prolyl cis-trans isomerase [Spirochaetaceae bacterium]
MASNNDKHVRPESSDRRPRGNSFVYIGTVVLLVITVVAFVFVPAMGSMGGSGGELNFGSWNGKPIAFAQGGYFASQVQQVKAQYESQGYKDSGDQFFAYQVWRRAFENTAVHLALLDYADKAGIAASESYIDSQMVKHPSFQEGGSFSKRKYREASDTYKLSLRRDLASSAVKSRYVSDSVGYVTSQAETAFLKAMAQSRRSIEFVAVPFDSYPNEERAAYAEANADRFRRARLSKVTISSSRKDAEQILSQVRSGALSFEDAAKNHSKDPYAAKGGDMGFRYAWELSGDLKDAAAIGPVLALPAGSISDVVETIAGAWSFYRVEEAPTAPDFASADLLKSVGDYMERNEKGRIEDWAIAEAASFAKAAKSDFASAAAAAGYQVKSTSPFPLNYGDALDIGYFSLLGSLDAEALPELRGADSNERFLQAVFSLDAGEVSEPVVHNDNAIVVRVKEINAAGDGELDLLEAYYPMLVQQNASSELASAILADPLLKDDFIAAFSRAFAQAD